MNRARRIILCIGSLRVTVAGLLLLAALVVWGTLFQAGNGLYPAQVRIFQAWFFWVGGLIPVPGMLTAGALLFVNLLAAASFRLRYRWSQAGLILIHYGLLLLLAGGFLALHLSRESYLTLAEGESSNLSSAPHDWELAVWVQSQEGKKVAAADMNRMRIGRPWRVEPFGLELIAASFMPNCAPSGNEGGEDRLLREVPVSADPAENVPGGTFLVRSGRSAQRAIVLFGGDASARTIELEKTSYFFSLRLKRFVLPATIRLIDFQKTLYPGSDIPRSYESRVEIEQGPIRRETVISMNRPLRLRGYTFYQSSYASNPNGGESSTLAVVQNSGRLFPYVSTAMIFLGLALHFLRMIRRGGKRRKGACPTTGGMALFTGALLVMLLAPLSVRAGDVAPFLDELRRVVVLENGRLKPLDSVARNALRQISGKNSFDGKPAAAWLERVLFFPEEAYRDEIFRIRDPDVLSAMGVARGVHERLSFAQLYPGLVRLQQLARKTFDLGDKKRSSVENEIIRLYRVVSLFYELSLSMQWAFLPESSGAADSPRSFLAVVPDPGTTEAGWHTASEIIGGPAASRGSALPLLEPLRRAAIARRGGRLTEAELELKAFNGRVRLGPGMGRTARAIEREILYNRLDPFSASLWCYGLSLLLVLLSFLAVSKWLRRFAFALLAAGFGVQGVGIALRMAITGRPPVTNLYETFLFVAWVGAALGSILALISEKSLGILSGAFTGFVFLLISGRYTLEGDTMGMLVAVLDTNLWLAVHVVTVTMGYAGCVVAGIIGHVYIVQTLALPKTAELLEGTDRSLFAALAFGLVLTFLGTAMGGIWADLSWGRFWGWDPKENGALLIILWVAILFHARRGGLIGRLGMAAGSVVSIITVVLAWFGVNLLGVGMHSYGFTAGVNRALAVFVLLELAFLAVSIPLARRKKQTSPTKKKNSC